MPPIIDAHIHLWPQSAANTASHGWMRPDEHLAKQFSIEEYMNATEASSQDVDVRGFVYVETDRVVLADYERDVRFWAKEPLKEIVFLKRIVGRRPEGQEGFNASHAAL